MEGFKGPSGPDLRVSCGLKGNSEGAGWACGPSQKGTNSGPTLGNLRRVET